MDLPDEKPSETNDKEYKKFNIEESPEAKLIEHESFKILNTSKTI